MATKDYITRESTLLSFKRGDIIKLMDADLEDGNVYHIRLSVSFLTHLLVKACSILLSDFPSICSSFHTLILSYIHSSFHTFIHPFIYLSNTEMKVLTLNFV